MPTRLVASHTPDRCWTENGMRCVESKYRVNYTANGQLLSPAQYRVFTPGAVDGKVFVAYWHMVGGKPYDYGDRFNAVPQAWLWWKDTFLQGAHGSKEQIFIRIVSETPLEQLWRDKDFEFVMTKVASLGLWQAAQ